MSVVSRTEQKYQINPLQKADLIPKLLPFMKPDGHGGIRGYMVRSLYFDSVKNRDFWEKVDGIDNRSKIRIRTYDAGGVYKLELKQKSGALQQKHSLVLSGDEADMMQRGKYHFLLDRKEPVAGQIFRRMTYGAYRPKCLVEYHRIALMLPDNDTRVTFDSKLSASESHLSILDQGVITYPVTPPDVITLEVKYNHFLLSPVKQAIGPYLRQAQSMSKYCQARCVSMHYQGV